MEGMRRQMYVIRDPKSGIYKYKREYPADLRAAIGARSIAGRAYLVWIAFKPVERLYRLLFP
jgi:hypothetical protein